MTEIILGIVCLAIIGLILWLEHNHDKERSKFINALIAKTPQDHVNLQMADSAKALDVKKMAEDFTKALGPDDDLIPMGLASDELFDEALKNEREDFEREAVKDV